MNLEVKSGDPYVLNVQKWVNNKFRGKNGYSEVTESGYTGWPTIYALLHALQITLEVGSTANNFGPGTESAWNKFVRENGTILERTPEQDEKQKEKLDSLTGDDKAALEKYLEQLENIHGIIQGALLCKGYSIGTNTPTGNFYSGTGNAIKKLKRDAGLNESNTVVTLNLIKALLSMDYFFSYNTSEKNQKIIEMQRYLNGNYEDYIGLRPCDGVYGRSTNTALIYAIQAEENMPTSVANGNFGPSTKRCCPTIPYNNVESDYNGKKYSQEQIERFSKLVNMGLYVNGIGNGSFDSAISSDLVKQFQKKYALPTTGIVDLTTWLSLFISCGDTTRSAKACDCATILTAEKAKTLYDNGYRYVGRYLSGTIGGGISKALTTQEMEIAFSQGLRIFPIHQGSANYVSYFTEEQAVIDVESACRHAKNLGIPKGTIIYFAVDCDPVDTQITSYIIPYFAKIFAEMVFKYGGYYNVGIYGTRNACTRVSEKGYAISSFVGDMSTGFSGNLGFNIPDNWAFDQFATVIVGSGEGKIEIDKDAFSGKDKGIGSIYDMSNEYDYSQLIGYDTLAPQPAVMINTSSKPINVFATKEEGGISKSPAKEEFATVSFDNGIWIESPEVGNHWGVAGNKVGEIQPGDFFIRFECRNHEYDGHPDFAYSYLNEGDSVHKVLFRNSNGVIRYGYIQEIITSEEFNLKDSKRQERENFFYYNFDAETGHLIKNNVTNINDAIYIVKRDLTYLDTNGNVLGVLKEGMQVKGPGNTGANYHDYMYFSQYRTNNQEEWKYLDTENSKGGFVDLDMANGVNGYDRALW